MVYLLKMVIFHSYVSLPEGNSFAAVDNNDVDAERQRVVATTFSMWEGGVKVIGVGKSWNPQPTRIGHQATKILPSSDCFSYIVINGLFFNVDTLWCHQTWQSKIRQS